MNEQGKNHGGQLVAAAVILALALVYCVRHITDGLERIKLSKAITVKGLAEQRIVSDMAVWRGSFLSRAALLTAAYDKLEKDQRQVLNILKAQGIPPDCFELSSVSTTIQHKRTDKGIETSEIDGYVLAQTVTVTSSNVEQVAKLSREASALIKEGIEFVSGQPEFYYSRWNEMKLDLLSRATADARRRAECLAAGSGNRIGVLRSAQQGVFQITPIHSTEVSDFGCNDTTAIQKKITAVVTCEYAIR